MRVGDVYKINRMIAEGHKDDAIMDRFKNDYKEDELKSFIKSGRADNKAPVQKKGSGQKKTDPLG